MKKEIAIHFVVLVFFFLVISVFKRYFALSFWPFWVGGLVGTMLPDVDHLIYVYFLRPHELTSQRVDYMVNRRDYIGTLQLLYTTRSERTHLIFHSALFQGIFLVLAFLVMTSSGSVFGEGLVLAFLLHLVVDQGVDLIKTDNLNNWFRQVPIVLDQNRATLYFLSMLLTVLFFGIVL